MDPNKVILGKRVLIVDDERDILETLTDLLRDQLGVCEVGFLIAGIKRVAEAKTGDTVTDAAAPTAEPFPGFTEMKPMVFAGIYPVEGHQYPELRDALEKLRLNDSSFQYEPETSAALGFGFRCGFLGFLHCEIIQERLEREYNLSLIATAPTVRYRVVSTTGEEFEIESPAALPEPHLVERIEEPMIVATIHLPQEYVGPVIALCQERRGIQRDITMHGGRAQVRYELPLAEVVADFHDKIKSATRGYGSYDYDLIGYKPAPLQKLDILVNGDPVDALSLIVHKDKAFHRGSELTRKLKEFIPRQKFEVAIQAAIGSRVIARTTVKALRKNVTAKCYGHVVVRVGAEGHNTRLGLFFDAIGKVEDRHILVRFQAAGGSVEQNDNNPKHKQGYDDDAGNDPWLSIHGNFTHPFPH